MSQDETDDDHGNTPQDATVLRDGDLQIGSIVPNDDIDYFRIDVTPEEAGYISILWRETEIPTADHPFARFALFNSDETCATRECEFGGGATEGFGLTIGPGTYYLRVIGHPSPIFSNPNPEVRYYTVGWETGLLYRRLFENCAARQSKFQDPLYGCQNSLRNLDHPGEDINVEPAWEAGALGDGVKVVIADSGIDETHHDLDGAVDMDMSTTVVSDGRLFTPKNAHGTNLAGIIAAQHNDVGMRGIAPNATIINFRWHIAGNQIWTTPERIYQGMTHQHQDVGVSSNSWGFTSSGMPKQISSRTAEGIEKGIREGFGGKGTSYVFALGNTRNSNFSELETFYAIIPVCGVDESGKAIRPATRWGGYGSNLWVCAPFYTWATHLNSTYTWVEGKSFATGMVSGVVALVRGVNPELTWRDVKLILAGSARQNDPNHPEWTQGAPQYRAPDRTYHFNEHYGFGVVDAGAAVDRARSWVNLPPMKTMTVRSGRSALPDNVDTMQNLYATANAVTFIEFVEVNLTLNHQSLRDLSVELVSPEGTVAMLMETDPAMRDMAFNDSHRFGSSKFLGESPQGEWTLRVADRVAGGTGTLENWSIKFYGHGTNSPQAPTDLAVFPHDTQGLDASWEPPASDGGSHITGYTVQWKEADESWSTPSEVSQATVAGTTYTINGLTQGVEYAVRVIASNAVGDGEPSAETTGTPRETIPPQMVRPRVNGATLTVYYDEDLDKGSTPPADAFVVKVVVRGSGVHWQSEKARRLVEDVQVTGDTVVLTLASAVMPKDRGDYVVISYVPPSDETSPRVRDVAGNPAAGFRGTHVFNDTGEAAISNTPAEGQPTISITGTARVGEMLTAVTTGIEDADGLDGATYSYQWIWNNGNKDTDIPDATGATYTLDADDEGKTIKVQVSFTDDAGNEQTLTSKATNAVEAATNNAATGKPIISGTVQVGETLTADRSAIEDADGLPESFTYQWFTTDEGGVSARVKVSHSNATYRLRPDDKGKTVTMRVNFTDQGGKVESVVSDPTEAVIGVDRTERPHDLTATIAGDAVVLSWTDAVNGPDHDAYQILRHRPEQGESEPLVHVARLESADPTYTDTEVEPGVLYVYRVKAVVSIFGNLGEASGPAEVRVPAGEDEANADAPDGEQTNSAAEGGPTITGTAQVGETLTADTSGIEDDDGLDSVSYSHQWIRVDGGTEGDIPDATSSSYELADSDEGKTIKVKVSFTDDAGNAETLTSKATEAVAAKPNTPAEGQPTVTGNPWVGETLTADTSDIEDDDGLDTAAYRYQWSADGANIPDATGSTYTLREAEEGKTIKVKVSFTDDASHEETLISAATAAVRPPLTVSLENAAPDHDGSAVFTFEIRFSEEFGLSFKTLRDHAFAVGGGSVTKAKRVDNQSNIHWRITVEPDSTGDVTIVLPVTTDCNDSGAICTGDGRKLSNSLEFAVSGPGG